MKNSGYKKDMARNEVRNLQDIPNVGKAIEKDFILLGIKEPLELINKDPYQMYEDLCNITDKRYDPCVIDIFISAVKFMKGGPSKKWWEFTKERKKKLAGKYK
jgi:hypothetical protein